MTKPTPDDLGIDPTVTVSWPMGAPRLDAILNRPGARLRLIRLAVAANRLQGRDRLDGHVQFALLPGDRVAVTRDGELVVVVAASDLGPVH